MIYKKNKKGLPAGRQGFTLIELLVSITIFSLVISIALGLFTTIIRNQRKSMAIQNVQDNGRYLLGFMAKEIRMSEITSSDGESFSLDISHLEHGDITYLFSGGQILSNAEPINSDEVQVEGKFFVDGKTGGDNKQPRVTVVMKVKTTGIKTKEQAEINLQTTLSQRKLD